MAADTVTVGDVVYTCGASTATVFDYVGPEGVTVTIPASVDCPGGSRKVTVVGENAFANGGLRGIVLPDGLERVGFGAFFGNNLGAVTLPSTLKVLDEAAFAIAGVTTVTLLQGLTAIGADAFLDSSISAVTIPASVTRMDAAAFSTSKLHQVMMLGPVPSTSGDPFGRENRQRSSTVFVSVPYKYLDAYRAAGWGDFPSGAVLLAFDAPAPSPEPMPVVSPSPSPTPTLDAGLPANAALRVSPADAAPGTRITVSGSDFPADIDVTVVDAKGKSLTVAHTTALGEFTAWFTLDREVQDGLFRVTASAPSGDGLSISFLVKATEASASPSPSPSPSPSASPAAPDEQVSSSGSNLWIVLAGGFVLIAGGGAGAWWYLRSRRTAL